MPRVAIARGSRVVNSRRTWLTCFATGFRHMFFAPLPVRRRFSVMAFFLTAAISYTLHANDVLEPPAIPPAGLLSDASEDERQPIEVTLRAFGLASRAHPHLRLVHRHRYGDSRHGSPRGGRPDIAGASCQRTRNDAVFDAARSPLVRPLAYPADSRSSRRQFVRRVRAHTAVASPLLLIQGQLDDLVSPQQGREVFEASVAVGRFLQTFASP